MAKGQKGNGKKGKTAVTAGEKIVQSSEVIARYGLQGARAKKTRTLYCSNIVGKTFEEARLIAQRFVDEEVPRLHPGRKAYDIKVTNL